MEGLVCSRNAEAESAASVWGSSPSGISSSDGGGLWWACIWALYVFYILWAQQDTDSGQLTSHLYGFSPQMVARWLGAFLSSSPKGSSVETSLSPHLPLLFLVSCSGMLWSFSWIWNGLPWLEVWQWLQKWYVSILLLAVPKPRLVPEYNLYCCWVFYFWGHVFL